MNITLLSVSILTKPTKTGKTYQVADVAYKNNSFQGKVEGKQVMAFGATKNAFDALSTAQPGTTWEVTVVKNPAGYNDWTNMEPAEVGASAPSTPSNGASKAPSVAPKSNYETSEERAQRQILIVRQSSLSSAVSALTPGAKSPLKAEEVVSLAGQFENYVFGRGATGFEDIPDFDPKDFPTAE